MKLGYRKYLKHNLIGFFKTIQGKITLWWYCLHQREKENQEYWSEKGLLEAKVMMHDVILHSSEENGKGWSDFEEN